MDTNADSLRGRLGWSIALSALMIVAGLLAIFLPPVAGLTVTVVVGWLLIFSGLAHFAFAWHARAPGGILWESVVGVVYIVAGIYLLMNPLLGMAALTLALAGYLVAEAVLEFVLAFTLRPLPGSGWLLVDGIITLLLAVMIWRAWPSDTAWVLGTLVGISILFGGTARLMLSIFAQRGVRSTIEDVPGARPAAARM